MGGGDVRSQGRMVGTAGALVAPLHWVLAEGQALAGLKTQDAPSVAPSQASQTGPLLCVLGLSGAHWR